MYKNTEYDGVRFQPIVNGKPKAVQNAACFAGNLNTGGANQGFILLDKNVKSELPEDEFYHWINMCREHGLIIHESTPFRKNGNNNLYVEPGYDYHSLYTTLCCFRWATHYCKMVHEIVIDETGASFHQLLHHQIMNVISNFNHSWVQLQKPSVYASSGEGTAFARNDLRISVAWYFFFNIITREKREREKGYTYTALANFTAAHFPVMLAKNEKDVLNPRWRPLYEGESMAKKDLMAIYEECKKDAIVTVGKEIAAEPSDKRKSRRGEVKKESATA